MTWNLRSLRDDRSAVIETLNRCTPDVLFVQEAPRYFRAASKLAALARESNLLVACEGRSAPGVAILTSMRVDVGFERAAELPHSPGLHRRGVAIASLRLGDRAWMAASVHLGLDAGERVRHGTEIRDLLESAHELDRVVAGDLNETSTGDAWQMLAQGSSDVGALNDQPTFPARQPGKRIDSIFLPKTWRAKVISPSELVDDALLVRATDHRPVIVDVMD